MTTKLQIPQRARFEAWFEKQPKRGVGAVGRASAELGWMAALEQPEGAGETQVVDEETRDASQAFVIGNLMRACRLHFCTLDKPWGQIDEKRQAQVLRLFADSVRATVANAIRAIASNQRLVFKCEVDTVNFKKKGAKASLMLSPGSMAHALADAAGGTVLLVIEDTEELLAIGTADTAGEPNQKALPLTGGESPATGDSAPDPAKVNGQAAEVIDGAPAGGLKPAKRARRKTRQAEA